MKNKNLQELMKYSGKYKIFTYLSLILSGISSVLALIPFVYIWKIIKEVIEAISKLIKNKTVLIIAHRMRTVTNADKIVVLKDGIVAEQGTPNGLINNGKIFKEMVQKQQSTEHWKL